MTPLFALLITAGKVVDATAHTAYLDAGAAEGLQPGARVQLRRGACVVESVGDHHASCAVQGAQPGDSFALPMPPAAPPPPKRLTTVPADQLKRDALAVQAAALPPVEFHGEPVVRRPHVTARLTHAQWSSSSDKPWSREQLDVWTRGAPIAGGVSFSADMSARWYSARPGPVSARPDDRAQLYVWEAALRRNLPGVAFALGRLRPLSAPGATPLDGAQLGFRAGGGNEIGVFGGGIPDAVTMAPSFSAGTAGAYWRVQHGGDDLWFRHEARVAAVTTPELGRRLEAEGVGQLAL
ncbi:MAG TPA: hypothetical protein VLW85_23175, partial [Myxococcales bacterium]|nr:hypothetical protein [Myxococcales bacterium]